jgi:NADH:ubiquinone oxidoreductase subunit 6 (subunit J)
LAFEWVGMNLLIALVGAVYVMRRRIWQSKNR